MKEVKAGFECGLVFEGFDKMQELDIVEAYVNGGSAALKEVVLMRKNSVKNNRINGEVQRVLAEVIRGEIKDPGSAP